MLINNKMENADIKSVKSFLEMELSIPLYQRPYKWMDKNVSNILDDISNAILDAEKHHEFKYRIGTIILHRVAFEDGTEKFEIVDGQQRIITLVLLRLFLEPAFTSPLLHRNFDSKISQSNIHKNYRFIEDWFSLKDDKYKERVLRSLDDILEVVVIGVEKEAEAFQLFDSQNTRGRQLDPHDLLKAYHLREMKSYPYEMQHAVNKWESVGTKEIRELFELYLFPIRQWAKSIKSFTFTAKDIDVYKGIEEDSPYTYARRASKSAPYFQIAEPFISGNDFFEMVEHYLKLLSDIKEELRTKKEFEPMREILNDKKNASAGFSYVKNLFYCAVLCFYDKFRNFDVQVIKKLFLWAFMLRVDMSKLGFESVNKYAVGEPENYSNNIAMFARITNARLHGEIANMQITILRQPNEEKEARWNHLYSVLKAINGYAGGDSK